MMTLVDEQVLAVRRGRNRGDDPRRADRRCRTSGAQPANRILASAGRLAHANLLVCRQRLQAERGQVTPAARAVRSWIEPQSRQAQFRLGKFRNRGEPIIAA